jgi:hypothetical protein
MEISKLINSKEGSVIISVILGLGLAACFRASCKKGNCIVIKGPKTGDIQKHIYRIDNECFKYTPYVVNCDEQENNPISMQ